MHNFKHQIRANDVSTITKQQTEMMNFPEMNKEKIKYSIVALNTRLMSMFTMGIHVTKMGVNMEKNMERNMGKNMEKNMTNMEKNMERNVTSEEMNFM